MCSLDRCAKPQDSICESFIWNVQIGLFWRRYLLPWDGEVDEEWIIESFTGHRWWKGSHCSCFGAKRSGQLHQEPWTLTCRAVILIKDDKSWHSCRNEDQTCASIVEKIIMGLNGKQLLVPQTFPNWSNEQTPNCQSRWVRRRLRSWLPKTLRTPWVGVDLMQFAK